MAARWRIGACTAMKILTKRKAPGLTQGLAETDQAGGWVCGPPVLQGAASIGARLLVGDLTRAQARVLACGVPAVSRTHWHAGLLLPASLARELLQVCCAQPCGSLV